MKSNSRSQEGAVLHASKEKPACERCTKRKFQLITSEFALPYQHAKAHRGKVVSVSPRKLTERPPNMASDSQKTPFRMKCKAKSEVSLRVRKNSCQQPSKGSKIIAASKREIVPHSCSSAFAVLALKEALRTNKDLQKRLEAEINAEKHAACSAASEAMVMIARLQEEKAAVLMESQQFKRMAEEREIHDRDAIARLKAILFTKDEVNIALENEVATYRQMLLTLQRGTAPNVDSAELDACISRFNIDSLYAHSTYLRKCNETNFRSLISDDVRSNLISCFNQTGESQETESRKQPTSVKKGNCEIYAISENILAIDSSLECDETESIETMNICRKVSPLHSSEMLDGNLKSPTQEDFIILCESNARNNKANVLLDSLRIDEDSSQSQTHSCLPLFYDKCNHAQSSSFEDSDKNLQLAKGLPNFTHPFIATNGASAASSRVGIEGLKFRLQILEDDRSHMNRVNLTLQRENEYLKVLREVAQALENLRETTSPAGDTTKSHQPLFSLFRSFLTLKECSSNRHERGPPLLLHAADSNPIRRKHSEPGLSYLLEKSPDLVANRLMTRGNKVRVPHVPKETCEC